MKAPSGFSPTLGLVAALLLVIAGIAAALAHDDGATVNATDIDITSTTAPFRPTGPTGSVPGSSSAPTSTFTTLGTTATAPATTTSTTVKPVNPAPENAVNGLWASYTLGDRTAAARSATRDVIDALFSVPYSGEEGTFKSCHKRSQNIFDCTLSQPSLDYAMVAMSDATGNFKIVQISSAAAATTTSSSASG